MRKIDPIIPTIRDLWQRLPAVRRRQFMMLVGLMVVASLAEVASVAALLPFLGVLTAPERTFAHPMAQPVIHLFHIQSDQQLLIFVMTGFCLAVLVAGAIRLLLVYAMARYSFAVGADISVDVFRRTLYQPYAVQISRNSSEIIDGVIGKTAMAIGHVLVPLLKLFSASLLLLAVSTALIAIDPDTMFMVGAVFGTIYWAILRLTRRQLRRNSERVAVNTKQLVKSIQESLGGIRDILIDGTQEAFCRIFQRADHAVRLAQGYNNFISDSPRYVAETLGVLLIAVIAYTMSGRDGGLLAAIPTLGALALGAQRLLPVVQQCYASVVTIRGTEASLRDILALMDQPLPAQIPLPAADPIAFHREIRLRNVGFRYAGRDHLTLRNVDLAIEKGQRVGFIGTTGSGKSTLLDIITGLLPPTEGTLEIDGCAIDAANQRAWQAHIAHVPQSIYLSDSTIAENIAFGIPREEIDDKAMREAAHRAQLQQLIDGLPEGYDTVVGERGVRLSGGQRQRIGIARALYKRASVIVFDEATSALDSETERALIAEIANLSSDLTILTIAHRVSTLENCDLIFEVGNGGIRNAGPYSVVAAG